MKIISENNQPLLQFFALEIVLLAKEKQKRKKKKLQVNTPIILPWQNS